MGIVSAYRRPLILAMLLLLGALLMPGCMSQDKHMFRSTIYEPKTVELIEPHSGQVIWQRDIPVGWDLVINLDRKDQPEQFGIRYVRNTPPEKVRWEMYKTDEKNVTPRMSLKIGEDDLPGVFVNIRMRLRPAPEFPPDFIPFEPVDTVDDPWGESPPPVSATSP